MYLKSPRDLSLVYQKSYVKVISDFIFIILIKKLSFWNCVNKTNKIEKQKSASICNSSREIYGSVLIYLYPMWQKGIK